MKRGKGGIERNEEGREEMKRGKGRIERNEERKRGNRQCTCFYACGRCPSGERKRRGREKSGRGVHDAQVSLEPCP